MNQQFHQKQLSTGNPFASALVVIVGIIVIALSLALGFFVFLIIGGFMLMMALVVGVRSWWMQKRFGKTNRSKQSQQKDSTKDTRVIEGEFHEVKPNDNKRRRR